mmetsp:Transcript_29467/g.45584  ORF Transcript_29467/g.45584 Transcript_29467/m.45584 type:complete len:105 (+) Transcript_29467:206-520(+)
MVLKYRDGTYGNSPSLSLSLSLWELKSKLHRTRKQINWATSNKTLEHHRNTFCCTMDHKAIRSQIIGQKARQRIGYSSSSGAYCRFSKDHHTSNAISHYPIREM